MCDNQPAIAIPGYECVTRRNNTEINQNSAGGVAIYRNTQRTYNISCANVSFPSTLNTLIGDSCQVQIQMNSGLKFILAAVYIHPHSSLKDIRMFIYQALLPYAISVPNIDTNPDMPIILCGDFNYDLSNEQNKKELLHFMQRNFNLCYIESTTTTLNNTTLDCTFTRHINVDTMAYISYYSYHRPMINKITI